MRALLDQLSLRTKMLFIAAVSAGLSPGSMRPPGKLISPRWLRRDRKSVV